MRFRLVTVVFVVALISILLAWHVERNSRSNICGTWAYPTGDSSLTWTSVRYSDILKIEANGSFTKAQDYGVHCETCKGEWHTDESGLTIFHVTKVILKSSFGVDKTLDVDYRFMCRCSKDSYGFLIANEYLEWRERQDFNEDLANVYWRSYRRQ